MPHTFRKLLITAADYRKAIAILQSDRKDHTVGIRILQNKLDLLLGV